MKHSRSVAQSSNAAKNEKKQDARSLWSDGNALFLARLMFLKMFGLNTTRFTCRLKLDLKTRAKVISYVLHPPVQNLSIFCSKD